MSKEITLQVAVTIKGASLETLSQTIAGLNEIAETYDGVKIDLAEIATK